MYILVPIRRDGHISHLFISLANQSSMGEYTRTRLNNDNHKTDIVVITLDTQCIEYMIQLCLKPGKQRSITAIHTAVLTTGTMEATC